MLPLGQGFDLSVSSQSQFVGGPVDQCRILHFFEYEAPRAIYV